MTAQEGKDLLLKVDSDGAGSFIFSVVTGIRFLPSASASNRSASATRIGVMIGEALLGDRFEPRCRPMS